MHDCQKPSDMLIVYIIVSVGQYSDSIFFNDAMPYIPSNLFHFFCPFCMLRDMTDAIFLAS
jgi:hypothetical protein